MCAARSIPMRPWEPSVTSRTVFSTPTAPRSPSRGPFRYHAPNDMGRQINTLLFCSPRKVPHSAREGHSTWFFQNLQEIGEREGFRVLSTADKVYPVRDPKLRAQDGMVLEPCCSGSLSKALERTRMRATHAKDHSFCITENSSFKNAFLGSVAATNMHRHAADGLKAVREARSYFEGGNTISATNQRGECIYFVGNDLIVATHMTLRLDKFFAAPDGKTSSYFNETLLMSKYQDGRDPVHGLYLSGQIPSIIAERAQTIATALSDEETLAVLREMLAMALLTDLYWETEADRRRGKEIASTYLAQRDFVKNQIFAADLRTEGSKIVALPQIAYHLDCLMTPGPEGSMFLQDYDEAVRLLKKIKANAEILELTPKDLAQLDQFIQETRQLANDFRGLIRETRERIEAAGFRVIPTPGAFFSHSLADPKETENVNFLNAISGYSPSSLHIYYIASGAKTGDNLGKVLMDSFVEFLNAHEGIAVYFAGRNPADPTDFSEAEGTLNMKSTGPHCLSFELETTVVRKLACHRFG